MASEDELRAKSGHRDGHFTGFQSFLAWQIPILPIASLDGHSFEAWVGERPPQRPLMVKGFTWAGT